MNHIEKQIDKCIQAFTELKESLYEQDDYSHIVPIADGLIKLIESPKHKHIPNTSQFIRLDMGRAKGNTTLMCMLLNEFKYRDDWKVFPVVRDRHSVRYVFDIFHHNVNTAEQNIVDMRGYRHKGNVLVIIDSMPEQEIKHFIRSVGMHLSPEANLKVVLLGDCV